jgi:hypothetical protein
MAKKPNKPEAIPIRFLVNEDRNYDLLVEQIIHMQTGYKELVKAYQDGLHISECEAHVRAREALQQAISVRDAIKAERKLLQTMGEKVSAENQKKARLNRTRKNEDGEPLDDVIRVLNREHLNARPSEVWPHFKASLEEWTSHTVTEIDGKGDMRSYRYVLSNAKGTETNRPITYGRFRKLLSKIRGKNGN